MKLRLVIEVPLDPVVVNADPDMVKKAATDMHQACVNGFAGTGATVTTTFIEEEQPNG